MKPHTSKLLFTFLTFTVLTSCVVDVEDIPVETITISSSDSDNTIVVGETLTLSVTVAPNNATYRNDVRLLIYSSSVENVISLNPISGVVEGLNPGTAIVRAATIEQQPLVFNDVTITVMAVNDNTLHYQVDFEDSEDFPEGTVYNKTAEILGGIEGSQWAISMGNYTKTQSEVITLNKSAQMRWYTSNPNNLGYLRSDFAFYRPRAVSFRAKATRGLKVRLSYSLDLIDYQPLKEYVPGTNPQEFSAEFDEIPSDVYFRFDLLLPSPSPSDTARLTIDDVRVEYQKSPAPTSITLNATNNKQTLLIGDSVQLNSVIIPENTINPECVWSVESGAEFVDISSSGLVAALAKGSATIRLSSVFNPQVYGEIIINVREPGQQTGDRTDIYEGYYALVSDIDAVELKYELNALINQDITYASYGEARYALEEIDLRIGSEDKLYAIYNTDAQIENAWDGGETWSREHVWPCAKMRDFEEQDANGYRPTNSTRGRTSDLHNLRAVTPSDNSSHSDRHFSQIGQFDSFNPTDDHRGDVARILFYMETMYDHIELSNNPTGNMQLGYLDELLEWHLLDPVDDFEIGRNEKIYQTQGNRNPFIDHPEFTSYIYR